MYRFVPFVFALLFIGCVPQANDQTVRDLTQHVDSLSSLVAREALTVDSLANELHYQKVMANRTATKCHDYAAIVKKNPSQSIFIVNWVDRAFQWTHR